ncbi:tyrosine-type recombinase/integrase [Caballeronia novacaledonica]|uniref:Tyrosine-type recombinase/integrase n=1 Tax=Caballeronia novacaledonica TaxID=1544861 RepID=A0ACB5QSG9_9BURK|nr:tyrosine-type recombinase/integrase [Caballeronia novacaledonica]
MILETSTSPEFVIGRPGVPIPRFWSTAWTILCANGLARSTVIEVLRHIDAFYLHCDERLGADSLDTAISAVDAQALIDALQSLYVQTSESPDFSRYQARGFECAKKFLLDIGALRANSAGSWAKVERAANALAPLKSKRKSRGRFIRALPAVTLADFLEVASINNSRNPFAEEELRARNWLIIKLLLLAGLRRAECLILPIDALKQDVHPSTGEIRWWLDVARADDEEEDDSRFTTPSIKTAQSVRQLPVSASLARLMLNYVENWRGDPEHSFLFNSKLDKPLSAESVNYVFRRMSAAISAEARKEFQLRSGGKTSVSPHDLRHTCAVIRLKQFLGQDITFEEAMQRMRSFFGWSYESTMPLHYAKAAFEERLANVWGDVFDEHTNLLRNLPQ